MARTQQPQHLNLPNKFLTSPRKDQGSNWRIQIKQNQLVSQASTIILQRHTKLWAPLLKPLKLSSNLTPPIFSQILNKIKTDPKICFTFFNWAQKVLDFKPGLEAKCSVTRILFGSELSNIGRPILNSIIVEYPPSKIVPLLVRSRESGGFGNVSLVLSSVVECYCRKDMCVESLEVYRIVAKDCGVGLLSVNACNALLSLLSDRNETRLAWCCYASVVRSGIWGNRFTWNVVARILCKDGKFERISRILDLGIWSSEMFDLMIDGYSKKGDFGAAFDCMNEMCGKGIEPGFSTYSSILDGACRCEGREVIENVVSSMVEKGYLPETIASDYDLIIQKLCDLQRTFAVDLFFRRAYSEKIELQDATYGCMFRALLYEKGRVNDAIELYNTMQEKNISVDERCYNEFVLVLCEEKPSQEVSKLLVDIVRGGLSPEVKELSKYISRQCAEGQRREAEELLNVILDQGCLVDPLPCGLFVKWYCSSRQIDKAMALHSKLVGLKGILDTATCNVLLTALLKDRRIEDTMKVFDYMKTWEALDSESFSLMISGLCHEKELRKAMKLHDEMLELGLKPDRRTYKKLISGFQ